MPPPLGKFLLRAATRALIYGLKQITGVGAIVDMVEEGRNVAAALQAEQEKLKLEARVQQLEMVMQLSPQEAREVAREAIAEISAEVPAAAPSLRPPSLPPLGPPSLPPQGPPSVRHDSPATTVVTPALAEAVEDLVSAIPTRLRELTEATVSRAKKLGTAIEQVLPIGPQSHPAEKLEFYASFVPPRRPRYRPGDMVPHYAGWRFEALVGAGGFGEVWKIQQELLGGTLALKSCLDPSGSAYLRREAETVAALQKKLPRHPHLVP